MAAPSGQDKTTTLNQWQGVPDLYTSTFTEAASTSLQITVSAEAFSRNGRLFLRALSDGVPAKPSDVDFSHHQAHGA